MYHFFKCRLNAVSNLYAHDSWKVSAILTNIDFFLIWYFVKVCYEYTCYLGPRVLFLTFEPMVFTVSVPYFWILLHFTYKSFHVEAIRTHGNALWKRRDFAATNKHTAAGTDVRRGMTQRGRSGPPPLSCVSCTVWQQRIRVAPCTPVAGAASRRAVTFCFNLL